ncbi:Rhodanese-like domain-containing protein 4a protein [Thalictrum thalictroides]|uniref:Rhodanese-like domain-containing protein 4a protein n=1 Tax=Thalictrum thalictroides TaxID=46969 RepID=A0A7J6WMY2_THATH|nr:Rhodanese-like domain-containing protein 4a protein [Thalictrum thalictroides]
MEISSLGLSSFPSIHNHLKSRLLPENHPPLIRTSAFPETTKTHFCIASKFHKTASFFKIIPNSSLNSQENIYLVPKDSYFAQKLQLSVAIIAALYAQFPCFATEIITPTEQISNKIDLEAILVSIDDFFNRNPFFVSGVTFIWLVVIPLTQEYLKKFKFISAIDAFQKLKKDPNSQLLDIRDKKSLLYLGSPNLNILNKKTIQVQFLEGDQEGFVKNVLKNFKDPGNTTICILDNFDGNSMEVAALLFKNGFKEAYAIRGGLRGKKGWQAIQETLLPPSVHVLPKNGKEQTKLQTDLSGQAPAVPRNLGGVENGYINTKGPSPQVSHGSSRSSLSPYPNYPDMKPPSSPTPSKPQN